MECELAKNADNQIINGKDLKLSTLQDSDLSLLQWYAYEGENAPPSFPHTVGMMI